MTARFTLISLVLGLLPIFSLGNEKSDIPEEFISIKKVYSEEDVNSAYKLGRAVGYYEGFQEGQNANKLIYSPLCVERDVKDKRKWIATDLGGRKFKMKEIGSGYIYRENTTQPEDENIADETGEIWN